MAQRGARIAGEARRTSRALLAPKDIAHERFLKLSIARRGKSGEIGGLTAVKRLAEAPHMFRHGKIANAHLAQIAVEIAAKHVEKLLSDAAPGIAVPLEPGQHKNQVQHDQIKSAFHRIRHAVARVKGRGTGLRHDRAIEVTDVAATGSGSKTAQDHKVNAGPGSYCRGRPIANFGALGVRHAAAVRKLGTRMRGTLVRSFSRPAALACAAALALALAACSGETFQRGYVLPEGALEQIPLGASQEQVLLVLGTPSTVATVSGEAFYYISQKADRPVAFMQTKITDQRVIAVYFDRNRKVQRLAEYGMKDGHLFDFVSATTPTGGNDLNVIVTILHNLQGKGS